MQIQSEVNYSIKEFSDEELKLAQSTFGLMPQNIYFNFSINIDLDTEKYKLFYVYGLSGEGKTIFKNVLLEKFVEKFNIIDYDNFSNAEFFGRKISEIFDLHKDREFLITLFSTFGLFEMRNIFSKFEELSLGQQKRICYMYLIYEAFRNKSQSVILLDEFLTFVDSLSAKVFVTGLRKFLKKYLPNTLFLGFGCNDNIISYWEDVLIILQNGKIYETIEILEENRDRII